tara:strand:- start:2290 stop:2610 length:321 start_codon:yes stop_codon:yes gene_type:complete
MKYKLMKYKLIHNILDRFFNDDIVENIQTLLLPPKNKLMLKDLLVKSHDYYTNYNGKRMYINCYKVDWTGKYYNTISLHCDNCNHILFFLYRKGKKIDFKDCDCDL